MSRLLKLYTQKMLVAKASNVAPGDQAIRTLFLLSLLFCKLRFQKKA